MYAYPPYAYNPVPVPAPPVRNLVSKVEVFSDAGDHFLSCTWTENSEYYYALADPHNYQLNSLRGKHLPRQSLFAVPPSDLVLAKAEYLQSSRVYVKRLPIILHSDKVDVTRMRPLNQELIAEARMYQMLQSNGQHPNICAYYGIVVRDGYLEGLALERCSNTLMGFMKSGQAYDTAFIKRVMSGLRSAVDFLHSLGYAHNDLNPGNIGLDSKGNVKLFDLDACKPFNVPINDGKCGTPGWGDYRVSSDKNDAEAMERIEQWMHGKYDPMDHMGF